MLRIFFTSCALLSTVLYVHAVPALAQEKLTLSVTPPLYQIAVEPGDYWQSAVKVINTNPYELTVYAKVVNFQSVGESGHGRFVPLIEGEVGEATLAGWIDITKDAIVIPREQSKEVKFSIAVPEDASPGGHFAAILIGTQPSDEQRAPTVVQVSQMVTSLFFVRVGGDIDESGDIREFSVDRSFVDTPQADFVLRFENKGNVHLQPQGEITIYNMWGKERGFIPINQKTNFGNVLPESIRQFEFNWKGESSLSDIGRYTAEVNLVFGQEGRHTVTRTVAFYVVPVKATLITLLSLGAFMLFVTWAIRRYVRRAIQLAGYEEVPKKKIVAPKSKKKSDDAEHLPIETRRYARDLAAPLRAGVIDLRKGIIARANLRERLSGLVAFVRTYRLFFISSVVLLFAITAGVFFLVDVLRGEKSYEITIEQGGADVTLSSEEVIKDRLDKESTAPVRTPNDQEFSLTLVNANTNAGTAAHTAIFLEELGYRVDGISADIDRSQERTVIIYSPSLAEAAVKLSEQLGNALVSASAAEHASSTPSIIVIVGEDRAQ